MKIKKKKILLTSALVFCMLMLTLFIFNACGKNEYKIGFDANNGSTISYVTYKADEKIIEPEEPTRKGYSFAGWYEDEDFSGSEFVFNEAPKKDLTLYANWTLVNYAITYNLNGGAVSGNPNSYNIESSISLYNPIKEGYDFLGWTYSNVTEPTLNVNSLQGLTGDITFTANWAVKQLNVIIEANEAEYGFIDTNGFDNTAVPFGSKISINSNQITINGTTITAIPNSGTSQFVYSFEKWQINGEDYSNQVINTNTIITAIFKRETQRYDINFAVKNCDELGKEIGDICGSVDYQIIEDVLYNSSISSRNNMVITNSQTITAIPEVNTAQYSYSFEGWLIQIGYENERTMSSLETITGDITITAVFKRVEKSYTITTAVKNEDSSVNIYGTLDTNGENQALYGTSIRDYDYSVPTLSIGDVSIVARPTESNAEFTYSFVKWLVNGEDYSNQTITGDTTITAVFKREINKYNINIKANVAEYGNIDTTSINNVSYGSEISVDENTITINGTTITATPTTYNAQYFYSFVKWQINGEDYNNQTIEQSTTITAIFKREIINYTIRFEVVNLDNTTEQKYGALYHEGVLISELKVPYGSKITISGQTLTIAGYYIDAIEQTDTDQYNYDFIEWSVASGTIITKNITITAKFSREINTYTVTLSPYNENGGEYYFGQIIDIGGNSQSQILNVPYGTAITVNGNEITIGDVTFTAQPIAADDYYTYSFVKWLINDEEYNNQTTGKSTTIIALFRCDCRVYDVRFEVNNSSMGKIKVNDSDIDENFVIADVAYTYQIIQWNGTRLYSLTINEQIVTTEISNSSLYSFDQWTVELKDNGSGEKEIVITANFVEVS